MERHLLAGSPFGRLGRLSDVARAVLFLCSEDTSSLTSTMLTIDGGHCLRTWTCMYIVHDDDVHVHVQV